MSITQNLGIPLIEGITQVGKKCINDAFEEIDRQVLPVEHENSKAHFEMWQPNTVYAKKAAVRTTACPSWGFYSCSIAGTSGSSEPQGYGEGDVIADGTCTWILMAFDSGKGFSGNHGDLAGRNAANQHTIAAITDLQDALNKKVDVVQGKGLSSNDYDNVDKGKVDNLTVTKSVNLDDLAKDSHTHANIKPLDKIGESAAGRFTYDSKTLIGGAADWTSNVFYDIDELIVKDNLLYKCISAHTSANFSVELNNWQQLTVGYIPIWVEGDYYTEYQVVTQGSSILRCTIAHTAENTFSNTERNNWEVIAGKGAIIPEWQPNTEYGIDEAVIYSDVIYLANTNHTSSTTFAADMIAGFEKWRAVGGNGGSGEMLQVTKLGVIAPKLVELVINYTDTFCLPTVEVLKFEAGEQDKVVTLCSFDNTDSGDFVYDSNYVEFDGAMKLKNQFNVPMAAPTALQSGYISESAEIDFSEYKSVEGVEIS